MISIKLNGTGKTLDSQIKLSEFIYAELNGKEPRGIAVALNETIIPRQKWETIMINENDSIDIVHAVQGG